MNILITATTYPRFKGDTLPDFVHNFAKELTNEEWVNEVHVLAPHAENLATDEVMDGVHVHRYRYWPNQKGEDITYGGAVRKTKKSPIYVMKLLALLTSQFFATRKLIKSANIDVVNAHWLIPMGTIAAVLKSLTKVPVLITIHGGDVFSLRAGAIARVKSWTLKHADQVVVNSSATEHEAKLLYDKKDYPIIPMGIDVDKLTPLPKTTRDKNDPLRLLFVGRLATEKGVKVLLDAMSILRQNSRNVRLTIVGDGPQKDEFVAQVHEQKTDQIVDFKGWVQHDDFAKLFANHDVFVGPSIIADNGWQEAFGLVFAESLALNTPVISTTAGGVKDLVRDEETGFLVPEQNVLALVAAIEKFIDNPKLTTKMADGARDDIAARFSWQRCVEKYKPLFLGLKR